jgi:hypothetical protein
VDSQIAWNVAVEGLEEREHVGLGVAIAQLAGDLTAREIHRCEQIEWSSPASVDRGGLGGVRVV